MVMCDRLVCVSACMSVFVNQCFFDVNFRFDGCDALPSVHPPLRIVLPIVCLKKLQNVISKFVSCNDLEKDISEQ